MNTDVLKGKAKQLQGEIKKRWGKLTDDEIVEAEGNRDKFVGMLQERYGYTKERALNEVNDFFDRM